MFEPCDCGSGVGYLGCCGRLHGGAPAPDAEALMRSRYSAFRRGNRAYLLKSWAAETRPLTLAIDPAQRWTGLTIHAHKTIGPEAAAVRFTARWEVAGRKGKMSETSRFRRQGEGWVYIDGRA